MCHTVDVHAAGCVVHPGGSLNASQPSRLALQHVEQVAKLRVAAALPCAGPQHLQSRSTPQPLSQGVISPPPQCLLQHALNGDKQGNNDGLN